jgi:DNA-binding transcriptional MerR regulator
MNITGIYSPKEITIILEIGDSTLRKWCIALEEEEYFFSRTDNNKRVFTDNDLIVLKHFRNLVKVQNMNMQNAATIVASKYKTAQSTPSPEENNENDERSFGDAYGKVIEEIEQLKDLNRQLLTRLDEQQKYIEERLDKRDSLIMESIRESQETKKLLLESAEQQKKPRKGLMRFFSKD